MFKFYVWLCEYWLSNAVDRDSVSCMRVSWVAFQHAEEAARISEDSKVLADLFEDGHEVVEMLGF